MTNQLIPRKIEERKSKHIRILNKKIEYFVYRGCDDTLDLCGTPIKRLPKDINYIDGNLQLSYSQISELPDNLHVNGYLDLEGCKYITSLPHNLTVKSWIDIRESNIKELPINIPRAKLYRGGVV